MTSAPGRFVDEGHRYRLESRIATGGMGEVWRATDTVLNRLVAVKILKHEYADDALFRSRFEIEARHAAALHHPGVAAVFDFGASGADDASGASRPFLVMELIEGQPLSNLLRPDSRMAPEAARDLMAQAADAIAAAHAAGIVHRDVKPANLMVTPDRRVKITDFGIARAAEGMALTQTGQVMGTPQYLSPEQAEGKTATPASDVYSLGVVLFECLAGRRPFTGETPILTALAHLRDPIPDLPPEIPADLAAVVRRSLSKNPQERYADGAAFASALRDPSTALGPVAVGPTTMDTSATQVLPGAVPAFDPTPTPSEPFEPAGSHRDDDQEKSSTVWIWVLLGLVVLALLVWLAVTQLGGDDDPDPGPTDPTTSATSQEPSDTPTSEDTGIDVNEGDYLGRPVDQVEQELTGLGLRVTTEEVDNPGDETEGNVTGVNPSGNVDENARITVTYWGPPPPPTEEPTEPTTPPTTEPTEPPTTEPTTPPVETTPTEPPTTEDTEAPLENGRKGKGNDR